MLSILVDLTIFKIQTKFGQKNYDRMRNSKEQKWNPTNYNFYIYSVLLIHTIFHNESFKQLVNKFELEEFKKVQTEQTKLYILLEIV